MTRKQQLSNLRAAQREGLPTGVEIKQLKLAQNGEATERWQRRLFRAARELEKLAKERKRLLAPTRPRSLAGFDWTPDKYVGSGGGVLDDDLEGV
jgi:hypothetical protein